MIKVRLMMALKTVIFCPSQIAEDGFVYDTVRLKFNDPCGETDKAAAARSVRAKKGIYI